MKELKKEELLDINGGAVTLSATLLNALVRGASVFIDAGRSLGSALRRVISGKSCKI